MSSSLALRSIRRHQRGSRRAPSRAELAPRTERAAATNPPPPPRLRRYLPLAVLTTSFVIVLPALLGAMIVPSGGLPLAAVSAASAIAVSVALASAAGAVWKRRAQSRDVLFADLMLWGWVRRCWTERRLSHARDLYDTARKAGPAVSAGQLTGLSRLLEARDRYTHGHGQRVARHAWRIARAMHLPAAEVARIRAAAAVHDVGKLYTPREILNNPGRLTDAEFAVVKRHPVDGAEMLAGVGDPEIPAIVRHHHERIDGRGYPDGLRGEAIPLGARIVAVADTFDALTSNRAYRPAATQKNALDILDKEAGSQLDADAVAAFRRRYSARSSVAWFALAAAIPQRIVAAAQTASLGLGSGAGGVASILPALGAAGLLSVAPGLRDGALVHPRTSRQPVVTLSEQPIFPPAAATVAPRRQETTPTSGKSPRREHHASGGNGGRSAPASRRQPASEPTAPSTSQAPRGHEPAAPPTNAPSTPPATPLPPVGTVPPAPAVPINPPVNVPGVPIPEVPVPVPPIPVPSLPLPAVETPAVNIQSPG
jgi:HD-GYP domain-containing protein (c-di-GMP phosphodiesterase class II)